jgi:hypothetical protein
MKRFACLLLLLIALAMPASVLADGDIEHPGITQPAPTPDVPGDIEHPGLTALLISLFIL